MIRKIFLLFLLSPFTLLGEEPFPLFLIRKGVEKNLSIRSMSLDQERIAYEEEKVNSAYDFLLTGSAGYLLDRSQQTNVFAGEERNGKFLDLSLLRHLSTGTSFRVRFRSERTEILFSPFSFSSLPLPLDPQIFLLKNPAYLNRLEVGIQQPLFRNWGDKELRLRKEMARSLTLPVSFRKEMVKEGVAYQIEVLWIRFLELSLKRELLKKMRDLLDRFVKAVEFRQALSLADRMDLIQAEGEKGVLDQRLLEVEEGLYGVLRELTEATGVPEKTIQENGKYPLDQPFFPIPFTTPEEGVHWVEENGWDFQSLRSEREILKLRLSLNREREKPQIGLLGSFATSGLDSTFSSSFRIPFTTTQYRTLFFGVEASFPLFSSKEVVAEREQISIEEKKLDLERERIFQEVEKNLRILFERRNFLTEQFRTLSFRASVVDGKVREEERKLAIGKGVRPVLIRYEMEKVQIEMERVSLLARFRLLEAEIRYTARLYQTLL
jgi:hypothetical protein